MHTAVRGITKNNRMDGNILPTVGRYTKGCVRLCESAWAEVVEIKREEGVSYEFVMKRETSSGGT